MQVHRGASAIGLALAGIAVPVVVSVVTAAPRERSAEAVYGGLVAGVTVAVALTLVWRFLGSRRGASPLDLGGAIFVGASMAFELAIWAQPPQAGPGFGAFLLAVAALPVGGLVGVVVWGRIIATRHAIDQEAIIGGLAGGAVFVVAWLVAIVELAHIAADL